MTFTDKVGSAEGNTKCPHGHLHDKSVAALTQGHGFWCITTGPSGNLFWLSCSTFALLGPSTDIGPTSEA